MTKKTLFERMSEIARGEPKPMPKPATLHRLEHADRCRCAECLELDQMRFQGIPDTFQLKLFADPPFDRYWRIRTNLPERHGQRLRVLARGKMNSALIEFEDGVRHVVSRNSFRKVKGSA